jgi:hypothetical protein
MAVGAGETAGVGVTAGGNVGAGVVPQALMRVNVMQTARRRRVRIAIL